MPEVSKAAIRRLFISQRDTLTPSERKEKSDRIRERVLKLDELREAQICLLYASFRSEVETDGLIPDVMEMGKRVALPITDRKTKMLLLCEITKGVEGLIPSTYGIREPVFNQERIIPSQEIDLFLVPGVAFDCSGTRLGYGGGYYDRLLSQNRGRPVIALAYEIQIAEALPCDGFDMKVKKIATETRSIDCHSDREDRDNA